MSKCKGKGLLIFGSFKPMFYLQFAVRSKMVDQVVALGIFLFHVFGRKRAPHTRDISSNIGFFFFIFGV